MSSPKCQQCTEVYSRVCGFYRLITQWNSGKQEEYKERVEFTPVKDQGGCHETDPK